MKVWLILFFVLMAGAVNALDSYTAEYEIVYDQVLVKLDLTLDQSVSEFIWILPADAAAVEVPGLDFELVEQDTHLALQIRNKTFSQIQIKYMTKSLLEKTKDEFFILDLGDIATEKKKITLLLPEKAVLKYTLESSQSAVIPKADQVSTDGKRIILSWKDLEENAILVIFNRDEYFDSWWVFLLIFAVLAAIGLYLYYKRPQKEAAGLTQNLFGEEKKLVELLFQEGEMWQKQLELKSGLSKVKLSRRLRNLEQKGLIKKIPYGNTNKIRLIKEGSPSQPEEPKQEEKEKEAKNFTDLKEFDQK
ncbi:MAG: hypothetical protein ABIA37_05330 [Candidatus Woesearchaeota archaeon]